MQPFQAVSAAPHFTGGLAHALKDAVDEICATLARLIAYLGTLALMFIVGVYLWNQLPEMHAEASAQPDWAVATRSIPAFASNQYDLLYKSKSYLIFRHPEGGRRDVLRWNAGNGQPVAEVEIYRPGGEFEPSVTANAAGIVDSKFGPVMLLKPDGTSPCLRFLKAIEQPALRISGFVCQGETLPARGAAIACLLNRLSLIAAGNDARLAEVFARADLKRADCRTDWISGSAGPALRGAI
ncbi:MAG: hypothetical protein GY844_06905 [Bradyrhizobium sp.]|nr:hypothetical protein [Bradyrhizobium sp.]